MREAATMGEAAIMTVIQDARRIGGMREEGDGRGHNDDRRKCRDEEEEATMSDLG